MARKKPPQPETDQWLSWLLRPLDGLLEACIILDFNWSYVYINDAAMKFTGRTKKERIGHTIMEVFPGIEKQDTFVHLKKCMESRTPEQYETEFTFPDGRKAWFEVRCEPINEGIFIFYLEITERKLADQRLERELERLKYIKDLTDSVKMQPIGILMIEHRLIERVGALLAKEKTRIKKTRVPKEHFIEFTADFFWTYVGRNHLGKEEDILFKALESKQLTSEHSQMMSELVAEHRLGRKLVAELVDANGRWEQGDEHAREQLLAIIDEMIKLYKMHFEKEDKQFFIPSMRYFSPQEQNEMLLQLWEFDRKVFHEKYQTMVAELEQAS